MGGALPCFCVRHRMEKRRAVLPCCLLCTLLVLLVLRSPAVLCSVLCMLLLCYAPPWGNTPSFLCRRAARRCCADALLGLEHRQVHEEVREEQRRREAGKLLSEETTTPTSKCTVSWEPSPSRSAPIPALNRELSVALNREPACSISPRPRLARRRARWFITMCEDPSCDNYGEPTSSTTPGRTPNLYYSTTTTAQVLHPVVLYIAENQRNYWKSDFSFLYKIVDVVESRVQSATADLNATYMRAKMAQSTHNSTSALNVVYSNCGNNYVPFGSNYIPHLYVVIFRNNCSSILLNLK